jgi:hypothetical protein
MDVKTVALREKVAGLIREAAEAKVALDQAEGRVRGVPHYSVIEEAAHELGCEVSRMVQEIHLRELVARQSPSGKCPGCGALAPLELKEREVLSGDGPIQCLELAGYCSCCRRTFFPAAGGVGV